MNKLELSSLYQLTMIRFKLILREPEAIFWIFIFPILLAVGLGIAFQKPARGCVAGGRDDNATDAGAGRGQRPDGGDAGRGSGHAALATGRILMLAIQRPDGVAYKFDDTNPDARTARMIADRAIQSGGRTAARRSGRERIGA